MKKYNYIVSVLMMVLSGYILFETGTYEIGQSAQKNPAKIGRASCRERV